MTSSRFIELVWLMLPAYCANMAPPFVKYWHGWNRPISRARWIDILFILTFTFVADIAVNHASFYIGVRNTKW